MFIMNKKYKNISFIILEDISSFIKSENYLK